jgi:hypothetical protein
MYTNRVDFVRLAGEPNPGREGTAVLRVVLERDRDGPSEWYRACGFANAVGVVASCLVKHARAAARASFHPSVNDDRSAPEWYSRAVDSERLRQSAMEDREP